MKTQNKRLRLLLIVILSVMLTATMFLLSACTDNNVSDSVSGSTSAASEQTSSVPKQAGIWSNAAYTVDTEIGEGKKTVEVEVKVEDHKITFTVHTDEDMLGDALLANNLIAGEKGDYGLYIKTVNGITADYDADKSYWAFYQNGEYMTTGADSTKIVGGEHYELVYSK